MAKLDPFAASFMRPKRKISVLEWAESAVELSERITEQPGPYSTRFYPYVREVLECMNTPPRWGLSKSRVIMLGKSDRKNYHLLHHAGIHH